MVEDIIVDIQYTLQNSGKVKNSTIASEKVLFIAKQRKSQENPFINIFDFPEFFKNTQNDQLNKFVAKLQMSEKHSC